MTTDLMILADVGGTNTRVALARGGAVNLASIRRYPNAGRPGLEPILSDYLSSMSVSACDGACVAAAWPSLCSRLMASIASSTQTAT